MIQPVIRDVMLLALGLSLYGGTLGLDWGSLLWGSLLISCRPSPSQSPFRGLLYFYKGFPSRVDTTHNKPTHWIIRRMIIKSNTLQAFHKYPKDSHNAADPGFVVHTFWLYSYSFNDEICGILVHFLLMRLNTVTKTNLGRKGLSSSSSLQFIMKESEGRKSEQEPGSRNYGGALLTQLLPMTRSTCFLR